MTQRVSSPVVPDAARFFLAAARTWATARSRPLLDCGKPLAEGCGWGDDSAVFLLALRRPTRRRLLLAGLVVALIAATWTTLAMERARGSAAARCQQHAADADVRARLVTGQGEAITVIGDSWTVGLGLGDLGSSWPSRLPGRVSVAGFSGSGFSKHASRCGERAFATRADAARGSRLVVVAGGLNDFDQPSEDIRAGFDDLLQRLQGHRVVIVGPASAPSRAGSVARVDSLLADLSQQRGVPYISATDVELDYLRDRLHLTAAGHAAFGAYVAAELATRGLVG